MNIALPLSMIREEPTAMRAGDWIGVAMLLVAVAGFSVAVRQLARIANAAEADRERRRADQEEAGPLAGGAPTPAEELPLGPRASVREVTGHGRVR